MARIVQRFPSDLLNQLAKLQDSATQAIVEAAKKHPSS